MSLMVFRIECPTGNLILYFIQSRVDKIEEFFVIFLRDSFWLCTDTDHIKDTILDLNKLI